MTPTPSGTPPTPPPSFHERLLIPVEIPAWGVITGFIAGAFAFGILYNQLAVLVKNQEKVDLMYERQIKNIENVARHEKDIDQLRQSVNVHEQRIQALERGPK